MANGPVDLDAHRAVAAQRLEVMRRKQLQELRAKVSEMKIQQDALEKRLLAAIAESEKHIASIRPIPADNNDRTTIGTTALLPSDGNAANISWLPGGVATEIDAKAAINSHQDAGDTIEYGSEQATAGPRSRRKRQVVETAIVYCEANFGGTDGETANSLVRHSEKYQIIAVIDSRHAGKDAGAVLDGTPIGIPVCRDLADSIARIEVMPSCFIIGMAPSNGLLSTIERSVALDAMRIGMDVVNGLHEFLSEDEEFIKASTSNNVQILDLRKPKPTRQLKMFTGSISRVTCPRIAVLGTDCSIGKRMTATILSKALNDSGVKTVIVSTGQAGLIQGARYGAALDVIPSQFCSGELETAVIAAFEREEPDLIIVEGKGALSHPALSTSAPILHGSQPASVILQHAPGRTHRCNFEGMAMPDPADEIRLIECFANTRVIGLAINPESMSDEEVLAARAKYRLELGIPTAAPLIDAPERLTEMVVKAHPHLLEKLGNSAQ